LLDRTNKSSKIFFCTYLAAAPAVLGCVFGFDFGFALAAILCWSVPVLPECDFEADLCARDLAFEAALCARDLALEAGRFA
jgi:hypothetical protein